MAEIAHVSAQYTTMGKVAEKEVYDHDEGTSDFNTDVVRIHIQHGRTDVDQVSALMRADSQWDFVGMLFRLGAMASMVGLATVGARSGFSATSTRKDKGMKDHGLRDFLV